MKITKYKVKGPKLKAAVVADLHGNPTEELHEALKIEKEFYDKWSKYQFKEKLSSPIYNIFWDNKNKVFNKTLKERLR